MVSRDVIAQLEQDVTTAEDAGDHVTAERLRREVAAAVRAAGRDVADEPDRAVPDSTGVAPLAPDPAESDSAFVRREAEDRGPGSHEQREGIATDVPGSVPD